MLVSFFGGLGLGQVAERDEVRGLALYVASLLDIAGTKMAVVQECAELRERLSAAVESVDVTKLPVLTAYAPRGENGVKP